MWWTPLRKTINPHNLGPKLPVGSGWWPCDSQNGPKLALWVLGASSAKMFGSIFCRYGVGGPDGPLRQDETCTGIDILSFVTPNWPFSARAWQVAAAETRFWEGDVSSHYPNSR